MTQMRLRLVKNREDGVRDVLDIEADMTEEGLSSFMLTARAEEDGAEPEIATVFLATDDARTLARWVLFCLDT
jgi:hypothetical protein